MDHVIDVVAWGSFAFSIASVCTEYFQGIRYNIPLTVLKQSVSTNSLLFLASRQRTYNVRSIMGT